MKLNERDYKVLESLEFPRWDVKYGDETKGEERNVWFDKIAKKIGLGDNLRDSDQDVKPRVKEIAVKTNVAKTFSSYLWAAVGVGVASAACGSAGCGRSTAPVRMTAASKRPTRNNQVFNLGASLFIMNSSMPPVLSDAIVLSWGEICIS